MSAPTETTAERQARKVTLQPGFKKAESFNGADVRRQPVPAWLGAATAKVPSAHCLSLHLRTSSSSWPEERSRALPAMMAGG